MADNNFQYKSLKDVNHDYNKKRAKAPRINALTNVPESSIDQLEQLAKHDGSKKEAILTAITERHQKIFGAD